MFIDLAYYASYLGAVGVREGVLILKWDGAYADRAYTDGICTDRAYADKAYIDKAYLNKACLGRVCTGGAYADKTCYKSYCKA